MSFFDFRYTAVLVRFTSGYYGGYSDHVWKDLEEEYGHKVEFRTYNSIRHKDMLEKLNVSILPTFYLYQRGVLVKEVKAPKIEELRCILDAISPLDAEG
jgi:hypothetical protein